MKTIVLGQRSDNGWLAEPLALAFPSVNVLVDNRQVANRYYEMSAAENDGIKRWMLAEEYRQDSAFALREAARAERSGEGTIGRYFRQRAARFAEYAKSVECHGDTHEVTK